MRKPRHGPVSKSRANEAKSSAKIIQMPVVNRHCVEQSCLLRVQKPGAWNAAGRNAKTTEDLDCATLAQ